MKAISGEVIKLLFEDASAYVSTAPAKNWNGCAAPASEAEQTEWAAQANATGEPLCDPGFLEPE